MSLAEIATPTPSAPDAWTGQNLFGYEVLRKLGDGAGGSVYAVRRQGSGEVFALKHILRKDEKSQRYFDQIANELDVSKRVDHANVRKCLEVRTRRAYLVMGAITEAALVMELLEARPLEAVVEQGPGDGVGGVPGLVVMMYHAAMGMAAINRAGYVHCDMKPANIMIDTRGVAKVIDLGQAGPDGVAKKRIQGSPNFISPEQFKLQPVTFRTDVFNFGATLYWSLTGKYVPTAYTRAKGLMKGRSDDAPAPNELRADVPKSLGALVRESVRSDPRERPESMIAIANRLGLILREIQGAKAQG